MNTCEACKFAATADQRWSKHGLSQFAGNPCRSCSNSTFLDIETAASYRSTAYWIPNLRMTEGHSRGHLSWPQHATTWSQEWRNDVKPCLQSSSRSLLETCIALDWMACYKRIAEIANIFKTGHLHPCMGSNTNWPRVSEWSCTWLCFTWPVQKVPIAIS